MIDWISVDERQPKDRKGKFVRIKRQGSATYYTTAFYSKEYGWRKFDIDRPLEPLLHIEKVTHWAEINEPEKTE
jgi:hypothetical protein